MSDRDDASKHWLVRPASIRKLWVLFIAILALSVAAQIIWHVHGHFGLDETFGFAAWYGFVTCVAMIVVAKVLGIFLKRRDDYYDA